VLITIKPILLSHLSIFGKRSFRLGLNTSHIAITANIVKKKDNLKVASF